MSSTRTKIEDDLKFLRLVKIILRERVMTMDDPSKVQINLPETMETYLKISDRIEGLEYRLTGKGPWDD